MRERLVYLIFCLSLYPGAAHLVSGQVYLGKVQQLSVDQGLSSRFANDLLFDHEGFLWVATDYGLNRYDGFDFTWLTSQTMGWRSDITWMLAEDDQDRIWIATKDRSGFHFIRLQDIYLLDRKSGKSCPWQEAFPNAPVQPADINQMVSSNGAVYISTFGGQLYRIEKGTFTLLFEDKTISLGAIYATSQNTIVVKSFVVNTDPDGWYIEVDLQGRLLCRRPLQVFWQFLKADADGTRWIMNVGDGAKSLPGLIYSFNGCDGELRHHDLKALNLPLDLSALRPAFIHYNDKLDAFWISLDEKVFVFNLKKGLIHDFSPALKEPILYVGNGMGAFGPGKDAWMVARNTAQGVFHLNLSPRLFRNYLPDHACRGMLEDGSGKMIVSTQSGMRQLDPATGDWRGDNLMTDNIALLHDRNGQLWTGNSGRFSFTAAPKSQNQVRDPIGLVWSMAQSTLSGNILLGGENGIGLMDPQNDEFSFKPVSGKFSALNESRKTQFLEERPGVFWLASSTGLYLLDEKKGVLACYNKKAVGDDYLPVMYVNHIWKDAGGIMWLATRGDGLVRWDRSSGQAQSFKIEQGLSHNILYAVYEDRHNGLWLSSDRGIMRFDKISHQVQTFLKRDGIPHEEFNTASHYQASDGRIWFGGLNGVTVFDPDDFYKTEKGQQKTLHISQFQQFDATQNAFIDRSAGLAKTRQIVLNPGDKFFVLKVSPLDFDLGADYQFAWKIEGIDAEWNYQQENTIRVNGLPAGDYQLFIKAQSTNGQWTETLQLGVSVKKPFYQQNWFYLLLLLLAGALIWSRFRSVRNAKVELEKIVAERTNQIENDKETIETQAAELLELDKAKSRFFANVSHELRTPLTLILGPAGTLLKSLKLPDEAKNPLSIIQRNARNLLQLVEELLDLSRLDAGKLQLQEKPVLLKPLVQRIMASFESQAEMKQIGYTLHYDPGADLNLLIDSVKLERIVTNLLSNAFRHTPPGGKIDVQVQIVASGSDKAPESIEMQVADTGRGIHPDELPYIFERFFQAQKTGAAIEGGSGIGLALCREYAQLFGGKIIATSTPGLGSAFSFVFPKKELPAGLPPARVERPEAEARSALPVRDDVIAPAANDYTILLVEDNPDMQQFVKEILQPFGTVITANTGKEALGKLDSAPEGQSGTPALPDLIVSDVMMPEMDGFALLEALRADERRRHIPVVMLTARAGKEDRLHALRFGVDDYLTKPFDADELQARVGNLLQRLRQRRESSEPGFSFAPLTSADDLWLKDLEQKSLAALDRQLLTVTYLADEMALSERQLRRKIQQLTGMTPNYYLREVRLQKSRHLLESRAMFTVAEVSYAVGFSKPDYFTQLFFQRFGKTPSAYLS